MNGEYEALSKHYLNERDAREQLYILQQTKCCQFPSRSLSSSLRHLIALEGKTYTLYWLLRDIPYRSARFAFATAKFGAGLDFFFHVMLDWENADIWELGSWDISVIYDDFVSEMKKVARRADE